MDTGYERTHDVATKKANNWGFYDMHGNVWEWCIDWYDSGAAYRVERGGSWFHSAALCRAASRFRDEPGHRDSCLGFRPALVPSR